MQQDSTAIQDQQRSADFRGKWISDEETAHDGEAELVRRISRSFAAMKTRQEDVSQEYLPSHGWRKVMDNIWADFRDDVKNDRYESLAGFFRNFFRNQGISGLWGGARMFEKFVNAEGPMGKVRANAMLSQYSVWREEFPNLSLSALDAPRVGNPWGYRFEDHLLLEPVFEYHYQANYFAQLLAPVSRPVVVEIGGGFGGLAKHIIDAVEDVTYIGLDLPENAALQQYYLSSCFPDRSGLFFGECREEITDDDIRDHDFILLPNFALSALRLSNVDLFVNIRSLSEMSHETISEYFHRISETRPKLFFHENLYKPRKGNVHGIPSSGFPPLDGYTKLFSALSRWPKYGPDSVYPCKENLFARSDLLA